MNRRQFLFNSLTTMVAWSWSQWSRADAATPAMEHRMDMSKMAMPEAETPMVNGASIELNQLISGEPLKALTAMNLTAGDADIYIKPSEQVWQKNGTATHTWSYQAEGGTLIEVMEGDQVVLTAHNDLPENSTIHWHGIDIPSDQDGHPHMPIEPKSKRTYAFTIPEGSAGTYWYHPHPHKRTSFQSAQGLAAPIIIRSKNDPLSALDLAEHLLFFTAPQLDDKGQIAPISMSEQMNGRVGSMVLVNGQLSPVLNVAPNTMLRLRLVNATNARYLRLSFGKTAMVQIASDGGLLEAPLAPQTELLLAPAERAEVCVTITEATTLQALPYDKGWMDGGMGWKDPTQASLDLLQVKVAGDPVKTPTLPTQLRSIKKLGEAKTTRQFILSENMAMSMAGGKHSMTMDFLINGKTFDMQRVDFTNKVGEVELWEIINNTDMDHPFHIHGSQFQVIEIEENGKVTPYPYLAWKDTINTKAGQTVRLKIAQSQAGLRMYHCHVLEHEDLGMMGQFEVKA